MILFLHIEKTAGTSLGYYLKSKFGHKFIDLYPVENGTFITDNDIKKAIRFNHKPQILSSHKIYLDKVNLDIFKYVIITTRSPLQRFLSHVNHLNELNKLDCINLNDVYSHEDFINLQYKKLGGKAAFDILNKLYNENRLLSIKQSSFKEDLKYFINEEFDVPSKNIRRKKELPFNNIVDLKHKYEFLNQDEIKLIDTINNFKITYGKNSLEFTDVSYRKYKVKIANFYRKYYRLPLLIIKYFFNHKKIIHTKNMNGYYICKK